MLATLYPSTANQTILKPEFGWLQAVDWLDLHFWASDDIPVLWDACILHVCDLILHKIHKTL